MSLVEKAAAVSVAALFLGCASGGFGKRPEVQNLALEDGDSDVVKLSFQIRDADLTESHVVVDYSYDGASDWQKATLTGASQGRVSDNVVRDLWPTSTYTTVTFYWDTWQDGNGIAIDGEKAVTVKITAFDVDGVGTTDTELVTVNNNLPVLSLVENKVAFVDEDAGVVGGVKEPTDQELHIENAKSDTTLIWRVTSVVDDATGQAPVWLTAPTVGATGSVVGGGASDILVFQAETGTLARDSYHAVVTITGEDPAGHPAHNPSAEMPVTLVIRNAQAGIFVHDGTGGELSQLTFSYDQVPPPPQVIYVKNSGEAGTLLTWELTDDLTSPDWLDFAPSSGENLAPGDPGVPVAVSVVDSSDLASDEAHITVSGHESTTGEPTSTGDVELTVLLKVAIPPTIVYGPGSFAFYGIYKSADPDPQTLYISNSGVRVLNWTVTGDANWLTLLPGSGSCTDETDEVEVRVTITDLASGSYSTTITITDDNAQNSPQIVPVTLAVYEF